MYDSRLCILIYVYAVDNTAVTIAVPVVVFITVIVVAVISVTFIKLHALRNDRRDIPMVRNSWQVDRCIFRPSMHISA